MTVPANVPRLPILRQEEPGVDQLVQECFQKFVEGAILEERLGESHHAERAQACALPLLLQVANTSALSHASAPLENEFAIELPIEERLVIERKQLVNICTLNLLVDFK